MSGPSRLHSVLNVTRSLYEPLDGLRKFERLAFKERYDKAVITIGCTGDRELEFKEAKIFDVSIEPKTGGLIDTKFKLQFLPGLGKENLILQEHQNHEIVLSIVDAKIALKKGGQQDLGLDAGKDADDDDDEDSSGNGDKKPRSRREQLNA